MIHISSDNILYYQIKDVLLQKDTMKRLIYILLITFTAILNCSDLHGMPRGSLRTQISKAKSFSWNLMRYPIIIQK